MRAPKEKPKRKSVKISKKVEIVDVNDIKFGLSRVASEAKDFNEFEIYT